MSNNDGTAVYFVTTTDAHGIFSCFFSTPNAISRVRTTARSFVFPLVRSGLIIIVINSIRQRNNGANLAASLQAATTSSTHKEEFLPVYELPPTLSSKEPPHLTPNRSIDAHTQRVRTPIDVAHRNGYVHTGQRTLHNGFLRFITVLTTIDQFGHLSQHLEYIG